MPSRNLSLSERIRNAFEESGNVKMRYADLALAVYPHDRYPKAWNYPAQGGPPGCYMSLSAGIRRLGLSETVINDVRWIYPPKK